MAYEWMGLYLEDMEAALTGFESELIKINHLSQLFYFFDLMPQFSLPVFIKTSFC